MSKEILLSHIQEAKKAHLLWLKRAKHLIQDLPITENLIPLSPKECNFGKWLHAEGIKFDSLTSTSKNIKNIMHQHDLVHDIYFDIYEIYFIETKQTGILKKLHFRDKAVDEKKRAVAAEYYLELEEASNLLIEYMDTFETTIRNADENLLLKAI